MIKLLQDYGLWGFNGFTDFIIPFLIVLSVLVFVHEWGHYIVARMCGVKVDVFSIGFGKEIFGFTAKSGTRWKFSMIPLGGYVQMFGDTDPASANSKDEFTDKDGNVRPMTAEEKDGAFFTKPVWQRAAIVFAGPAINFLFAIILLFGLYAFVGKPVNPPVAAAIMVDGAGDRAGLQPQDRIMAINGKEISSFNDIQRQVAISLDTPLSLTVLRGGEELQLNITPERDSFEDRFGFTQSRGLIGIMGTDSGIDTGSIQTVNGQAIEGMSETRLNNLFEGLVGQTTIIGLPQSDETTQDLRIQIIDYNAETGELVLTDHEGKEIVEYGVLGSTTQALRETWFIITGTLEGLGQIITGTRSATELGGIVRIGAIAGDAAQAGLIALITFTALLSINLGLINLFPIPLLDGGHLVFYAYEAMFGKPMSQKVMEYALKTGMVLLIGLMAFANLNDIVQLIL
jgi:regulator of sigma E protease